LLFSFSPDPHLGLPWWGCTPSPSFSGSFPAGIQPPLLPVSRQCCVCCFFLLTCHELWCTRLCSARGGLTTPPPPTPSPRCRMLVVCVPLLSLRRSLVGRFYLGPDPVPFRSTRVAPWACVDIDVVPVLLAAAGKRCSFFRCVPLPPAPLFAFRAICVRSAAAQGVTVC
jgi:hypothetical protein